MMADKLFLLWRGSQRVVFNVEDLSVERIATVFKASEIMCANCCSILYNLYGTVA